MMQASLFDQPTTRSQRVATTRLGPVEPVGEYPAVVDLIDGRGKRDSSREALAKHKADGKLGKQQQEIIDFLRPRIDHTRLEIAELTGLRLSAVCGRVRELIDAGILIELPRRECLVSGKSAHPVRA